MNWVLIAYGGNIVYMAVWYIFQSQTICFDASMLLPGNKNGGIQLLHAVLVFSDTFTVSVLGDVSLYHRVSLK